MLSNTSDRNVEYHVLLFSSNGRVTSVYSDENKKSKNGFNNDRNYSTDRLAKHQVRVFFVFYERKLHASRNT